MKILGCLERPSRGRYWLGGIDVGGLSGDRMAEVRNRIIGFLFQSFLLLPQSTALENGEMPLAYAGVARADRRRRAPAGLGAGWVADSGVPRTGRVSAAGKQRRGPAPAALYCPSLLFRAAPTS